MRVRGAASAARPVGGLARLLPGAPVAPGIDPLAPERLVPQAGCRAVGSDAQGERSIPPAGPAAACRRRSKENENPAVLHFSASSGPRPTSAHSLAFSGPKPAASHCHASTRGHVHGRGVLSRAVAGLEEVLAVAAATV